MSKHAARRHPDPNFRAGVSEESENTCSERHHRPSRPYPVVSADVAAILATRERDPVLNRPKHNAEILRHVNGEPRRVAQPSVARPRAPVPGSRGVVGESLCQIGAVPPNDRNAMHRSLAACRRTAHAKRENSEPRRVRRRLIGSDGDPDRNIKSPLISKSGAVGASNGSHRRATRAAAGTTRTCDCRPRGLRAARPRVPPAPAGTDHPNEESGPCLDWTLAKGNQGPLDRAEVQPLQLECANLREQAERRRSHETRRARVQQKQPSLIFTRLLHWQARVLLRHQGHCLAASTFWHAHESSTGETEWRLSGARSSTAPAMRDRRRSCARLPAGTEAPWSEVRVVPSSEDLIGPPLLLGQAPLVLMAAPRLVFCVTFAPLRYFCAPFANPLSRRRDTSSQGIPNPKRRDASLDEGVPCTSPGPRERRGLGTRVAVGQHQPPRPRMGSAAALRAVPYPRLVSDANLLECVGLGSSVYRLDPNVMNVSRLNYHGQSIALTSGARSLDLSQIMFSVQVPTLSKPTCQSHAGI
jgi:hypothetical protein